MKQVRAAPTRVARCSTRATRDIHSVARVQRSGTREPATSHPRIQLKAPFSIASTLDITMASRPCL